MSRTLLVLALVALMFAGVLAQSSSSSTADMSSSTTDMSTGSSTSDMSSSTAVASSTASSTSVASSTGSSAGASSTAASSSTAQGSSTGTNSTGSSTGTVASSTGAAATTTVKVGLRFTQNLTSTQQNVAAVALGVNILGFPATGLNYTVSQGVTAGRRLLQATNSYTFTYANVDTTLAAASQSKLTETNLNTYLSTLGVDPTYATLNGNTVQTTSSASALAASPLVLAAAAVFAMLF